jgi:hypothetical protein
MRRSAVFLVLTVLAGQATAASLKGLAAMGGATLRVAFSSQAGGEKAETSFDCAGRIYAHLTFADHVAGEQDLEARWIRPDGVLQETTKIRLTLGPKTSRKTSVWLEFLPEERSVFDEFSFGGDYGGVRKGFHGPWTLKVLSNGKLIEQGTFSVACYK